MILNYQGQKVTVDDVSKASGYPAGFFSLSAVDLVRTASVFGLTLTHTTNQTFTPIKSDIDASKPVIALVNYAALPARNKYDPSYTRGHWILLVGYDSNTVVYHDPYWPDADRGAFKEMTWAEFNTAWVTTNSDFSIPSQILRMGSVPVPPPVSTIKVGLHMAARGGDQTPADWQAFDTAKLGAIKFLSNHALSDIQAGVQRVGASNVYFRMYADPTDPSMATGTSFFNIHKGWFDQLYPMGVVKYEISNEPNTDLESNNWTWWKDAVGFASWYRECATLIRTNYPKAKIMWPGLSPQFVTQAWIDQLKILISQGLVDIIGCHSYFYYDGTVTWGMNSLDGGQAYQKFLGLGRPLALTEASNNNPAIDPTTKGNQYLQYIKTITSGVEALLFFVSSTANPSFNSEVWAGTSIPSIVGTR